MNFKEILQDLLVENNINAKILSGVIDIDHSSLYEYLSGTLPNVTNAVTIANYFNCTLNFLFGLDNLPNEFKFKNVFNSSLFFTRYKKLLDEKNISHHKLCNETGVNKSSYWLWSKGSIPKCDTLLKIARFLDCSIDYLIGRSDEI